MAPPTPKVELEIAGPGVWTDITAWCRWESAVSTKFGRANPFSTVQPASFGVTLNNADGRFTAQRQTLADLVTPHPYWPNLLPKTRIRYSYAPASTSLPRFTGYVSGWPTSFDDIRPQVRISADDRLRQLAAADPLDGPYRTEVMADGPSNYWPLTGKSGGYYYDELHTADLLTTGQLASSFFAAVGSADVGPLSADVPGPSYNVPTALGFAAPTSTTGQYLSTPANSPIPVASSSFSLEVVLTGGADSNPVIATIIDASGNTGLFIIGVSSGAYRAVVQNTAGTTASVTGGSASAAAWAHVVVTIVAGGGLRLYVNGVLVGTTGAPSFSIVALSMQLGSGTRVNRSMGQLALYQQVLSASRIAAHYSALYDWSGETVSDRVTRLLLTAGVAADDFAVETSTVLLAPSPQDGLTAIAAVQALNDTEGNGSVTYVEPDGRIRFTNRGRRRSGDPIAIINAETDLAGDVWAPTFDLDQLGNVVTGTIADPVFAGTKVTARDAASIAKYGQVRGIDFTSYGSVSTGRLGRDVLNNANQRVAGAARPQFRLAQVAVDLWTCETPDLAAKLGVARIGDRLRLVNLPPTVGPSRTLDLIIEGWADKITNSSCVITFDTSPADNPAEAIWGDDKYGRWQANGQTLAAAATAAATTLQIASPAGGATFTTDAAMYPLAIMVGAERIQLNGPPSGSSSPQTFTGVTRGVDGTGVAAQAAGTAVELYPIATWTL